MKKTLLALTLATSAFGLAACGDSDDEVVVSTKYGDITKQEFYEEFKEAAGESLLQNMLIEQILENNYKVTDDEVEKQFNETKEQYGDAFESTLASYSLTEDTYKDSIRLQLLQDKAAKDVEVTDKEIEEYYNKAKVERKTRHILVADEDTANTVIKELKAGGDFAKLAKKYSTDTASAEEGGELGWVKMSDSMVPEFLDATFALELNTISEPVQSQYGYHIIEVTDTQDIKDYGTLEDKKDEIKDAIAASKGDFNAKIADLIKEAKVDIKDKDLKNALDGLKSSEKEEK